jgi:hypothetical protein
VAPDPLAEWAKKEITAGQMPGVIRTARLVMVVVPVTVVVVVIVRGFLDHRRLGGAEVQTSALTRSCRSAGPRRSLGGLTVDERDRLVERRPARACVTDRGVLVPDRHAAEKDEPVRG